MRYLFLAFRTYPYWAIPVALVFGQIGIHFRRRQSLYFAFWFGISFGLIVVGAGWVFFRGDLHSDQWLRWVLGDY